MKMLKTLPIVTILVAMFVAFKFRDQILGFLDDKAPSVSNMLKGDSE